MRATHKQQRYITRLCSEGARQPQRIYYDYGADPNSGLPSGGHVEATMSTEDRDYHREENELNSVIDETAKRPKNNASQR